MIKKYIATFLVGFFVLWYITPHVFIQIGRLRADVSIYRDGQGIARVTAHYLPDLFYAIGASLARDRLWSLYELKKRVQGQASSVIGSSELAMDKFIRSLNIKETVKGRPTNEQTLALLLSYVRGINDYAKAVIVWPFQFYLTWAKWEDWTVEDIHAVALYVSMLANTKVIDSVVQHNVIQKFGKEVVQQLLKNQKFSRTNFIKKAYTLVDYLQQIATDSVIVANTKHVDPQLIFENHVSIQPLSKELFYPIELTLLGDTNSIKMQSFGVMIMGLPALIIGTTGKFSWGIANITVPEDLLVEEETILNGKEIQYNKDGVMTPLISVIQTFKVLFRSPVNHTFLSTHNGPLISSISSGNCLSIRPDLNTTVALTFLTSLIFPKEPDSIETIYFPPFQFFSSQSTIAVPRLPDIDSGLLRVLPDLSKVFAENSQYDPSIKEVLKEWDGKWQWDSIQAGMYAVWERDFAGSLLAKLEPFDRSRIIAKMIENGYILEMTQRLLKNASTPFDYILCNKQNHRESDPNPCKQIFHSVTKSLVYYSLFPAYKSFQKSIWKWGNVHYLPLVSYIPLRQPANGGARTFHTIPFNYSTFEVYPSAGFALRVDHNQTTFSSMYAPSDWPFTTEYFHSESNFTNRIFIPYEPWTKERGLSQQWNYKVKINLLGLGNPEM